MASPGEPDQDEEDGGNADTSSLLSITRQYAHYATVGIMFPVATALGFFLGYLVDGWFGTVPLFAIIGMVLGVTAAIRNLLQTVATDENDGID
ncbi:MAG: AtpZ/AtpI family protein [Acidobacteriota bacterium]|jgi:F0F1-type ATP synthase assembly protein I